MKENQLIKQILCIVFEKSGAAFEQRRLTNVTHGAVIVAYISGRGELSLLTPDTHGGCASCIMSSPHLLMGFDMICFQSYIATRILRELSSIQFGLNSIHRCRIVQVFTIVIALA